MTKADSFRDFVLDQLREVDGLGDRAMFGGHGLYRGDAFFGIIFKGRLFFKTDGQSRPDYVDQGMKPFRPKPGTTLGTYYEVPADILESPTRLRDWALRSAAVILPEKRAKKSRRR